MTADWLVRVYQDANAKLNAENQRLRAHVDEQRQHIERMTVDNALLEGENRCWRAFYYASEVPMPGLNTDEGDA